MTGGINGGNAVAFNGNFFLVGGYNPGYGTGQPTPFPTMNTWTTSEWFQLSSAALNTAHTEDPSASGAIVAKESNLIRYYTVRQSLPLPCGSATAWAVGPSIRLTLPTPSLPARGTT